MPSPRTLLLLLLLPLSLLITCATTARAQTRTSSPACLTPGYGAAQDKVIARSLRRYEALKPLATQLRLRGDSLHAANTGLHRVIGYQDSARAQGERQLLIQGRLYRDAEHQSQVWRARARTRWWGNVGLGALALLLGAIAVK